MVAMSAEEHDKLTADAEFVTHLTGRILDRHMLPATPVSSREYAALCDVAEMTSGDTLDMFYGLYKYNPNAKEAMAKMRENLARIERQLAGKEAYLTAKAELQNSERQKLLADTRRLLEQIALDDAAVSVRRPRGAGSARTTSRSPSPPSNRVSRPSRSAATPSKREPLATKKPVTGSRPASRANGASPSTGAAKGQQ